jgi:hypothetical protein
MHFILMAYDIIQITEDTTWILDLSKKTWILVSTVVHLRMAHICLHKGPEYEW